MTPTSQRESAKIYQFPIRTRPAVEDHRDGDGRAAAALMPRYPAAVYGSGWYDDSAILEDERGAWR